MPKKIEVWDLMPDGKYDAGPRKIIANALNAQEMIDNGKGRYVHALPAGVTPGAAEADRIANEHGEALRIEQDLAAAAQHSRDTIRRSREMPLPPKQPVAKRHGLDPRT